MNSPKGRGTAIPQSTDESLAPPKQSHSTQGPATILIVDDDPLALELMTRSLRREGYRVVAASAGKEGLQLARDARPTAILLDVEMPGMDGWAVLSALRADPAVANIPVIMVTVVDEPNKGHDMGVMEYMVKPISRSQLVAAVLKCSRPKVQSSQPQVLVVEDDVANRELLCRLVSREGWTAIEAADGQAALTRIAALAPAAPDLILLDLAMPVMDGFEFVRQQRAISTARSIPIVVITARELGEEERRQLKGSVSTILQKGNCSRNEMLREIRSQVAAIRA